MRDPALVETEHALNHSVELRRNFHLALAPPEYPVVGVAVHSKPGVKCRLDLGRGAGHHKAPGRRALSLHD